MIKIKILVQSSGILAQSQPKEDQINPSRLNGVWRSSNKNGIIPSARFGEGSSWMDSQHASCLWLISLVEFKFIMYLLDSFNILIFFLFQTTIHVDGKQRSALNLYLIDEDANRFSVTVSYNPYLYVKTSEGKEEIVARYLHMLSDRLEYRPVEEVQIVEREDLDLVCFWNCVPLFTFLPEFLSSTKPNHLLGKKGKYLRVAFAQVSNLVKFRDHLMTFVQKNKTQSHSLPTTQQLLNILQSGAKSGSDKHPEEYILELREYDVPYVMRVNIDLGFHRLLNLVEQSSSTFIKCVLFFHSFFV